MDEVVITPEVKVDENLQNVQAGGEKPPETPPAGEGEKLFAGKYKTIEDLEKGYKELEKKLGAPKTPQVEEPPKPVTEPLKIDEKPPETPAPEGQTFQKYFDEFAQTGAISEDSYKELEAKGLPKAVVDSYIEGQKVQAERHAQGIYATVGGAENYTAMTSWAKDNLTLGEILAFNEAVIGTPEQAGLAVQGLYAKYTQANKSPKLVMGNDTTPVTGDVYESIAQLTRDMNTELYKKDPAEQKRVREKLGRSKIL